MYVCTYSYISSALLIDFLILLANMKLIVGYADLITDALSISALFSIGEAEAAWVNVSFISLETLIAVYVSEKTPVQILLTITHLGVMVEGYVSITTGIQTQGKIRIFVWFSFLLLEIHDTFLYIYF